MVGLSCVSELLVQGRGGERRRHSAGAPAVAACCACCAQVAEPTFRMPAGRALLPCSRTTSLGVRT